MTPRPHCYECGVDLNPGQGQTLDLQFWVFPASDASEGAEEALETIPTLVCDTCAVDFANEATQAQRAGDITLKAAAS